MEEKQRLECKSSSTEDVHHALLKQYEDVIRRQNMPIGWTLTVVILAISLPAHSVPNKQARHQALKALCPIGLSASGGWGDININSAIATIEYGEEWPLRTHKRTAFKVCDFGGYLSSNPDESNNVAPP